MNMPQANLTKQIDTKCIRESLILTLAEVSSDIVEIEGDVNQTILKPTFTVGDSDGVVLRVFYSHNGTNWFQLPTRSNDGTYDTYTPNLILIDHAIPVAIALPILDRYVKVTAQALADATGTLLKLEMTLGKV